MLIDFHAHLYDETAYGEALAETARNLGIDKLCLGGGEPRYGLASNDQVAELAGSYPDLILPFAHVELGLDGPGTVERLSRQGFQGLRVWAPPEPYDDESFFDVYEAAQGLGMPVLFHTGYLPRTSLDRAWGVSAAHMRPVYLDGVARCFPELKIVGVGMGSPWCEEAAETMRYNPNVYFDLSGDVLRRRRPEFFTNLLRPAHGPLWEGQAGGGLIGRIVFGSAVRHEEIVSAERDYQRIFRSLAADQQELAAVMGETAAGLLEITAAT